MPKPKKASVKPALLRKRSARKTSVRRIERSLQDRVPEAGRVAAQAAQSVSAQVDDTLASFEKVVKQYPLSTVGAALAMGIMLGLLVGR